MIERIAVLLKDKRKQLGYSVEDIVEKTKLYPSAVRDIEEGRWENISSVYLKGWLRIYASFLGIDMSQEISQIVLSKPKQKQSFLRGMRTSAESRNISGGRANAPVVEKKSEPELKPYQKIGPRPSYPPSSESVVSGSAQAVESKHPVIEKKLEHVPREHVSVDSSVRMPEVQKNTISTPPVGASGQNLLSDAQPLVFSGNAQEADVKHLIVLGVLALLLLIGVTGFARFLWVKLQRTHAPASRVHSTVPKTAEKVRKKKEAGKKFHKSAATHQAIKIESVAQAAEKKRLIQEDAFIALPCPKGGEVSVSVTAKTSCYIRAKVDGTLLYEGVLKKGIVETWKGDKDIELKLSDGSAVYLEVNGSPLPALSSMRKPIKSLKITPAGISVDK